MHAARLVVVLLLVLAVVVAYSPQARQQVTSAWESIRPAVVGLMDGLYAAIRNLVIGNDPHDRMDETPVPGPGVNFDRIVTLNSSTSL